MVMDLSTTMLKVECDRSSPRQALIVLRRRHVLEVVQPSRTLSRFHPQRRALPLSTFCWLMSPSVDRPVLAGCLSKCHNIECAYSNVFTQTECLVITVKTALLIDKSVAFLRLHVFSVFLLFPSTNAVYVCLCHFYTEPSISCSGVSKRICEGSQTHATLTYHLQPPQI